MDWKGEIAWYTPEALRKMIMWGSHTVGPWYVIIMACSADPVYSTVASKDSQFT